MGTETPRRRLDEILISEGLISEAQIKDALLRQKAHGGKFGSQLLYHRFIDEATLVKALSIQFNCEGVILSQVDVHEMVLQMVPEKISVSRRVVPFNYDPEQNVLMIACEDPDDSNLQNELSFVARGKNIRLYVAAELALNTAINKYYLGRDVSLDDNLLLDIPDTTTETGPIRVPAGDDPEPVLDPRPAVLVVTDEQYAVPLVRSLLERDNYRVVVTDSADDAIELLGNQRFKTVFIKDTVPGDYIDLIDRVRKLSPGTTVRFYETASSLLLDSESTIAEANLLRDNLDILTSLLSTKSDLPINHSGRVGMYADKLCRRLGLPGKERLLICTAGYIHDLAKFYYTTDETQNNRQVINMTAKLLASLGYSPVVVEMLRSMYLDLNSKYTRRLPIEVLGGNILTIADLFAESIPRDDRLSLDKFDGVKKKLRDLGGKLFLIEVVEAFIDMIQDELLNLKATGESGQVMIYAEDIASQQPLAMRLKNDGFRTIFVNSLESFKELYGRSEPDLMILVTTGTPDEICRFVTRLTEHGIGLELTPAYLMTNQSNISHLTDLLDQGIEDIISLEDNLDLLANKIRKLRARIQARAERAGGAKGAHGRLADMNLIDLLQALGPGRKTVRIHVRQTGDEGELMICLDSGNITYASLNDLNGPEAVYEGLAWSDGTWSVEPSSPEDLPEPNNDFSNESILMEGCRLLDEKVKSGRLL